MQDHAIVGVADHAGWIEPRAPITAKARPNQRFQTRQRDVHEQRRDIPSLDRPDRCREELTVIDHTRLEPRLEWPAHPGAGANQSEEGRMREPIEAWRDLGVQDILRLARDRREDGIDRILAPAPWTNAIAVGLKPRFPFWLER